MLAALGCVLAGALLPRSQRARRILLIAATALTCCALVIPAVAMQASLRQATAPWFHVNDSAYQIEVAGQLVRDGHNPYGFDYRTTDLARWYSGPDGVGGSPATDSGDGTVALGAFPYFPGTLALATAWGVLPAPFDDYRFLVMLCTLALLPAALLFPGPLTLRLALGAALVANRSRCVRPGSAPPTRPRCWRSCWRSRWPRAAAGAAPRAALGIAVVCKQFAVLALPFLAVALWQRERREAGPAALAFGLTVLIGIVPFAAPDPGAFWHDTIEFGAETYRIVGYGLSSLLLRAGWIEQGGVPVHPAGPARLATPDRPRPARAVAQSQLVARRRRAHHLEPRALLARAGLPDVVPHLPARGTRPGVAARRRRRR